MRWPANKVSRTIFSYAAILIPAVSCLRCVSLDRLCSLTVHRSAAEERAIRALNERGAPAIARKDTSAAVGLYTGDATLLWPNMPPVRGAEGIRSVWAAAVNTPGLALRVVPERIRVSNAGDFATNEGRIESATTGLAGTRTDTAKYLHVWTKRVTSGKSCTA